MATNEKLVWRPEKKKQVIARFTYFVLISYDLFGWLGWFLRFDKMVNSRQFVLAKKNKMENKLDFFGFFVNFVFFCMSWRKY